MNFRKFFKNQETCLTFLSCITILVVLWICTGLQFINPTNLYPFNAGDPAEHYLGWSYFRNEGWHFPVIGKIESYGIPGGSTIVLTDSIPLLAIIFKLFDTAFPNIIPFDFQYLGLFMLFSLFLQAYFAIKLLNRFIPDGSNKEIGTFAVSSHISLIERYLATLFFVFSPALVVKTFFSGHEALTAHWLILAGLVLYFRDKVASIPRWKWLGLILCALAIHLYLAIMVIVIFGTDVMRDVASAGNRKNRLIRNALLCVFLCIVVSIYMYMLGYSTIGLETRSFERYSLVQHVGGIFALNPVVGHESNNSLGLGIFVMLAFIVAGLISLPHEEKTKLYAKYKQKVRDNKLFCLALLVISCFSFGLFDIGSSDFLYSTFHASVRFFWLAYYVIFLVVLCVFFDVFKSDGAKRVRFLTVACIAQLSVLGLGYAPGNMLNQIRKVDTSTAAWEAVLHDKTTIVIYSPCSVLDAVDYAECVPVFFKPEGAWFDLAYIANKLSKNINLMYTSRYPKAELVRGTLGDMGYVKNLILNNIQSDDISELLFVIIDDEFWEELVENPTYSGKLNTIDGFNVYFLAST